MITGPDRNGPDRSAHRTSARCPDPVRSGGKTNLARSILVILPVGPVRSLSAILVAFVLFGAQIRSGAYPWIFTARLFHLDTAVIEPVSHFELRRIPGTVVGFVPSVLWVAVGLNYRGMRRNIYRTIIRGRCHDDPPRQRYI